MQSQPFSEYEKYYEEKVNKLQKNPNMLRDCPPQKPFYDTENKICIVCLKPKNLFNIETNKC